MRFDWYQTTIEDDPRKVVSTLAKLGDEVKPADGDAKRWRYRQGWAVLKRGHVVAKCFAGGNGDKPHALATSDDTDAFVDLVRSEWEGRHLVTRMDAAQDFFDEYAYDRLQRVTKRIAKKHRLRFASIEDELCSAAGRTQYIGSPTSDYRGRLYEKGFEVVAKALAQNPNVRIGPEAVETVFNSVTGEYVRAAD
ncbi:hypothetical protein ACUHMQ_20585, partial [Chitinimonas sp. PSY-7]|uniref:hypothetical protein n=1 Tax=Chitinimonas sp. PSY-7 TaxID=3459088 RepID=UPI00403FE209